MVGNIFGKKKKKFKKKLVKCKANFPLPYKRLWTILTGGVGRRRIYIHYLNKLSKNMQRDRNGH